LASKFDEELAASFVGKHLLIGLTYLDHLGEVVEQKQLHGEITRITPHEGVIISLAPSGDEFRLPPDLRSLQVAPPGEYRLRSTGEVVVNLDLLTQWTINKPASH
jgi:hypothetical protein